LVLRSTQDEQQTKIDEELKKMDLKEVVDKFSGIQYVIKAIEQMDELDSELLGFLTHWKAISPENSPDFEPEVYTKIEHEEMKAKLPFLRKCLQILKDKEYGADVRLHFEEKSSILAKTQYFSWARPKAIEDLRNGKTKDEIINSLLNQRELTDLHKQKMSIPKKDRNQNFTNMIFKQADKPPYWFEILRVTECEHCNFRYFLH
jgi:hypothetical protein